MAVKPALRLTFPPPATEEQGLTTGQPVHPTGAVTFFVSESQLPRLSFPIAISLCFLNWLIPGAGYIACKDYKRGIALFLITVGCFAIGLFLGGYVLRPEWSWRSPEFNFVAILTYIAQAFFGAGWLGLQLLHTVSEQDPDAFFNLHRLAGGQAYSDLGVFHLVVAGGLNYFATVRLYDLVAGSPELTESSSVKDHVQVQKEQENNQK